MGGDKTTLMRWPMSYLKEKRKWHAKCLQESHDGETMRLPQPYRSGA